MTPFKISSLEEVVMVHKTQFELNPTIQNRERLYKVQAELFRFLALEEEFWKQKAGTFLGAKIIPILPYSQ